MRFSVFCVVMSLLVAMLACDGRQCDQRDRVPCDNAASRCMTDKCGSKQGDELLTCFEYLCVPALCDCLDQVGCAWQDPSCDDRL